MRCPAGRGVRTGAIKTDRRDARKLVRLFRAGELTPIHVPDEAEEAARDLVRCREAVRRDVVRWRHRLLKLLDRHGRLWVTEKNWTQRHWTWIRAQHFELPALQRAFEATVFALKQALARQAALDQEIETLAATAPYREPVGWLRCFRGIGTLSAMVLLAEIVDFQRFRRSRELMAYLGLVPSEYSSGKTQRRGTLTKAGNTHARRVLVEAAWHYRHRPGRKRSIPGRYFSGQIMYSDRRLRVHLPRQARSPSLSSRSKKTGPGEADASASKIREVQGRTQETFCSQVVEGRRRQGSRFRQMLG